MNKPYKYYFWRMFVLPSSLFAIFGIPQAIKLSSFKILFLVGIMSSIWLFISWVYYFTQTTKTLED